MCTQLNKSVSPLQRIHGHTQSVTRSSPLCVPHLISNSHYRSPICPTPYFTPTPYFPRVRSGRDEGTQDVRRTSPRPTKTSSGVGKDLKASMITPDENHRLRRRYGRRVFSTYEMTNVSGNGSFTDEEQFVLRSGPDDVRGRVGTVSVG